MNGEPKMPYYEALEITVPVYAHSQKISVGPDEGVERPYVPILLSRAKKNGPWHIESVDRTEIDVWCPGYKRKQSTTSFAIAKALALELDQRGIYLSSVRGWTRYFSQWAMREVEEWWRTSQPAQRA